LKVYRYIIRDHAIWAEIDDDLYLDDITKIEEEIIKLGNIVRPGIPMEKKSIIYFDGEDKVLTIRKFFEDNGDEDAD